MLGAGAGEHVHLLDQRRRQGLDSGQHGADALDLCRRAGGDHHPFALARRDERSAERQAGPIAQRRAPGNRFDALFHRYRFAGEDGLLNDGTVRRDKPQVGGHLVAGLEQHDVPGHERCAVHRLPFAPAQHGGPRGEHAPDGVHGLLGLAFLNEADDRVRDYHREDHRRVGHVAQRDRDHGRPQQHVDQDVVKLQYEAHERAAPRWFGQAIRAVFLEP